MVGTLSVVTMVAEVQDGHDCGKGPTSRSGLIRLRVRSECGMGPSSTRCSGEVVAGTTATLRKAEVNVPFYVAPALSL